MLLHQKVAIIYSLLQHLSTEWSSVDLLGVPGSNQPYLKCVLRYRRANAFLIEEKVREFMDPLDRAATHEMEARTFV
jgi:hypothetical protein